MEAFDVVHSPLEGPTCLIEAGAGTGKTFTLTGLFLRLILEQGIAPERILTVTFTTAATAELRERLRRQLAAARRALLGQSDVDATLAALVGKVRPASTALRRVEEALRDFDRIPILTIHGFCQRLLLELTFETGGGFGDELVPQAAALIHEVAEDFWRRKLTNAAPEIVAHALKVWGQPEALAAFYNRFELPAQQILPPIERAAAVDFSAYHALCAQVRECWRRERESILSLLHASGLKANVYGKIDEASFSAPGRDRKTKLNGWAMALDAWSSAPIAGFPPPDCLAYFGLRKIAASLRRNAVPPQHPFFALSDRLGEMVASLQNALGRWQGEIAAEFSQFARQSLAARKKRLGILFFDDLLTRVADALQGRGRRELIQSVQRRYQVALVDEFQDTDPIQYRIFGTLFGVPPNRLFMIGDPKQAIYGFRGADIYAYLEAARESRRRFTLTANWRSFPGMIQAVNALFASRPRPFLLPEIIFRPAEAAIAGLDDSASGEAALTLWWVDDPDQGADAAAWRKDEVAARIEDAVVAEIVNLIEPAQNTRTPATAPSDIAVLVRTNAQARGLKTKLMAARVPAIIYNAGDVYQTPEARALEMVLQAVADPGDERKMRAALTTDFLGVPGAALDFDENPPDWWTPYLERFDSYRRTWQERGFMRMFRRLIAAEGIAERLLQWVDGERRVTNLLHLGELLHQAAVQQRAGLTALLNWLASQRDAHDGRQDEQQQRLESDAQGVNLLTVHKCKGLEFPVVFYPFGWEGRRGDNWPQVFHDRRAAWKRTLDLQFPASEDHAAWAQDESLAEDLRLHYVALTRAKRKCYMVWGRLPGHTYAAWAYLLHYRSTAQADREPTAVTAALEQYMRTLGSEDMQRDLEALVMRAGGSIDVLNLPAADQSRPNAPIAALPELRPRPLRRRHALRWQVASFSSLAHMGTEEREVADPAFEALTADTPPDGAASAPLPEARTAFPRGARAGLFLHSLLEQIDFTRSTVAQLRTPLGTALFNFGLEQAWVEPLAEWLSRICHTPLTPQDPPLVLSLFSARECLREMEFYFPLKAITAERLRAVLTAARVFRSSEALSRALQKLEFAVAGGYLKGYVDLIFRYRQRYFIVDWKSNYLGASFDDYQGNHLEEVVARENYFLQYYLYSLALHRYLLHVMPGYDYGRHFGGVYYLFLRGMDPAHAGCGIHYARPAFETLQALSQVMIDDTRVSTPDQKEA
jgi:exodeoxyribonuclease V beta subunit